MSAEREGPSLLRPITSLFGRRSNHFPVPTEVSTAAARSDGQGRRSRRGCALPLRVESTAAGCRRIGTFLFAASVICGGVGSARAQELSSARDPIGDFVAEAAQRFDIPEAWIRAIMRVESGGQVRAISSRGAMGLMQLMPATWADMRFRFGLGGDPFDAHDNVVAGVGYLRDLYDRFGPTGFLAAYNAGPGRYLEFVAKGRPLPLETRRYVATVGPSVGGDAATVLQRQRISTALRSTIFVALGVDTAVKPRSPTSLFAVSSSSEVAR